LAAWESVSLEHTLDIFPAAVVFEPERVRRGRSTFYGAGLSPIGFKLNFAQDSWIKPFVAASVGFLYFQEDVPVPRSARFNFTPEIGLGVQFFLTPKRAVTLGYKLHHISNATPAGIIPGWIPTLSTRVFPSLPRKRAKPASGDIIAVNRTPLSLITKRAVRSTIAATAKCRGALLLQTVV
jgi:hypothetical protein